MTIRIGDSIPSAMLSQMAENGPQPLVSTQYFAGRKVVLLSVPGAFTPTCSAYHLPGFVELADEFAGKGIDAIGCMSVNDVFVMHAWGQERQCNRH